MLMSVTQPFMLCLQLSVALIGLLQSINTATSAAARPFTGYASDRRGRKPLIILGSVCLTTSVLTYAAAYHWLMIIPATILNGLAYGLSTPALEALTAESINERRRATAYGVVYTAYFAPGLLAPIIGGKIAEIYGYQTVFIAASAIELVRLSVVIYALKETLVKSEFSEKCRPRLKEAFTIEKEVAGLYIATGVDAFAWALMSPILPAILTATFNFTPTEIGLTNSAFCLTMLLAQIPAGRLADVRGRKAILILSEAIGCIVLTGYLISSTLEHFIVCGLLFGLCAATWVAPLQALLAESVPSKKRAEVMGKSSALRMLASLPSPAVGGFLYSLWGFSAPVVANLVIAMTNIAVIAILVHERS